MSAPDHEFAFRPPKGWARYYSPGATFVKFFQPGEMAVPTEFLITHLYTSSPTPLESFKSQAKETIKEKYPDSKVLEEKDFSVSGKKGYRITFQGNDRIHFKNIIHRSNLEFYLLDAIYTADQADKIKPLIEASVATFEIVPMSMSDDEKLADGRTLSLLKGSKIDPALLGERWFSVVLAGGKKVGWMRFKMTESEGMYSFDTEVQNKFGEGETDTVMVRGSFSPDGRVQKIDTEEVKANPKQKWTFRASAVNQGGQVKISREINGIKEERAFTVEEGVLFSDVAECLRTVLVGSGKGNYLLKSLSPFSEDWSVEKVDVGGLETLEVDGHSRSCILVQSYIGRRKNMTYYYGPDRSILRVGGPKDLFSVRATTKENAQK